MALKPSQLAFEKSLLEERLRYVKRLKEDLEQEGGTTSQTVAAYTSIIDGAGEWNAECVEHCQNSGKDAVGCIRCTPGVRVLELHWAARLRLACTAAPSTPLSSTVCARDAACRCRNNQRCGARGAPGCADGRGEAWRVLGVLQGVCRRPRLGASARGMPLACRQPPAFG